MFNTTKLVLATAMVIGGTMAASAATKNRVADDQVANYSVIPGYDSQGQTVGIPTRTGAVNRTQAARVAGPPCQITAIPSARCATCSLVRRDLLRSSDPGRALTRHE